MGFLTSLFGGSDNLWLTVLLSLGIVVVLIVAGVWALKFLTNLSASTGRGRTRRLHIIESTTLDQKRRLILIRRDNVEHLIMTGGAQELVVEDGIAVPPPVVRRPARPARTVESERSEPAKAPPKPQSSLQRRLSLGNRRRATPQPPSDRLAGVEKKVDSAPVEKKKLDPAPVEKSSTEIAASHGNGTEPEKSDENRSPLDRLRELGRPMGERKSSSLRHTGLLRPVSRMETNPLPESVPAVEPQAEFPEPIDPDSAKTRPEEAGDETIPVLNDESGEGSDAGDGAEGENTGFGEDHKSGTEG